LDRNYLFAFVQSADFVQSLSELVKGALYPAVTDKQVRAQLIPFPPLPVQQRIAAVLTEQMAAVERARAAAEAQLDAARVLPAAYLRAVFNSPQAKRWERRRLGEVCDIIAGQSPPGATYRKSPEGLPFFQGKADFGERHPVARTWCVAPTKIALPGDILISVRAPVGPTNVADIECCIGRGLAAIRPHNCADRDFILFALRLYENELAKLGSGSTFAAINRDTLESLEIPLPPLPVQQRIAARLTEQMSTVERARKALEEQLDALNQLPAALLRKAFSGEL
jgi:type I restriction enzyme S subunit